MEDTLVWVVLLVLIFLIPVAASMLWAGLHPPPAGGYLKLGQSGPAFAPEEEPASAHSRAELAAVEWLVQCDAGAYVACWQRAAQALRERKDKLPWEQQMVGVRTPLGHAQVRDLQSAEFTESLPPGTATGKYVVVEFRTRFQYKEDAVEVVTVQYEADGVWRVAGYFIR